MVLEDIDESKAYKDYQYLVNKLNLDENTATLAWESYMEIRSRCSLEGNQLHWLGCAVFVACSNSITPTLGQAILQGNCVNLTSLLRHSELSLVQFFNKIKNWADMTKMPDEFFKKIENLHSKVAVTYNIFKRYSPIFTKIFNAPSDTDSRHHRNRKQKPPPCTPTKVFEFCWLMFLTARVEDESYSKDLVSSCHLLYACCDLAFKNAFLDDRRDLLNPKFSALPDDWCNPDYKIPKEAPCIISTLCQPDDSILTNAKYMKEYNFKPIIKEWFVKGILQGDADSFTELFSPAIFDTNFKNITKAYETHLLNKGNFDERIFLAEYRRQLMLKEQSLSNGNLTGLEPGESVAAESPRVPPSIENNVQNTPNTPLTGRKYLGPKETSTDTNAKSSQNASGLQNLLYGRGPNPSEELQTILKSCGDDPMESIKETLIRLDSKYCTKCAQIQSNTSTGDSSDAKKAQQASTLCYKFLENILKNERKQYHDISPLVQKVIFFECLYACCLEIVEFSSNSPRKFPWILNILEIAAFDFVKVIELTIRFGDQLPRDIVKHLSWVEERILESILWKTESSLWEAIANANEEIPKFEDTAIPGNMIKYDKQSNNQNLNNSNPLQSPGPSAVETFQSPNVQIINSQVKKNLFPVIKPGQSLLQTPKPTHLLVTDEDGNKKYVQIIDSNVESVALPPVADPKPKRGGSLCIIFRKFYNLAGVRMEHLCSRLGINDLEMKCKIWTIFEYSVRCTNLMKDRHLDQLLMCSVYVLCKVTDNIEKSFQDIMKCYRDQPQANNYIYRQVLVTKGSNGSDGDLQDTRADLIVFYNNVYVGKMEKFALKFSSKSTQSKDVPLSPLPSVKTLTASPRTEIQRNVYIKAYESPTKIINSGKSFNYLFSRSASKDLKDFNSSINTNKRKLDNYEADSPNKRPINRKMITLYEERERVQSSGEAERN